MRVSEDIINYKIIYFCKENNIDSDGVIAELDSGGDECVLVDFDQDGLVQNFPFDDLPSDSLETQQYHDILKQCKDNPDAFDRKTVKLEGRN